MLDGLGESVNWSGLFQKGTESLQKVSGSLRMCLTVRTAPGTVLKKFKSFRIRDQKAAHT